SSVIQGIAGGDNKNYLLKSGPKVLIYFGLTSIVTLTIAVIIAGIMSPGNYMDASQLITEDMRINAEAAGVGSSVSFGNLPAVIIHLIPDNPLASLVSGDMLSIVIFALIVGVSLVNIPEDTALPLLKVLYSVQEITMAITKWTMKLAPAAVFGLLCQVTSQVGIKTIWGLSMF